MENQARRLIIDIDLPNLTTANQFAFPDQPNLRGRLITGIQISGSSVSPLSGRTNLGYYILNGGIGLTTYPAYLSMQDSRGDQFIQQRPIHELTGVNILSVSSPAQGIYNTHPSESIYPRIISWTKSFLYFPVAPTLTGYTVSFIFKYS